MLLSKSSRFRTLTADCSPAAIFRFFSYLHSPHYNYLALNCTGYHALNNVLLTGQIEDDDRDNGQY